MVTTTGLSAAAATVSESSVSATSWNSNGTRGTDNKYIYWNANINYQYKDNNGTTHTVNYSSGTGFRVHYFAKSGTTLNFADDSQRAFCIEPDKGVELTGSGKYTTNTDLSSVSAWNSLSSSQQTVLNYVFACGYGNYKRTDSSANRYEYWYATQLLAYEVVANRRNLTTFEPTSTNYGNGFLNPSTYLKAERGAETSVSAIQSAYDNMIKWVKRCIKAPSYASLSASSAPTKTMTRNSDGTYSITLKDTNYIIDTGHGDPNTGQNTVKSDFSIENSGTNGISVTVNSTQNTVTFKTSKVFSGKVKVTVTNSFVRGLKGFASQNLSIIQSSSGYQAFARGCTLPTTPVSYFYLTLPSIKLEIQKSSSNSSVTNNSNYSLAGAKYGVWTNSDCSGNYYAWITTDKDGYGYFGDSSDITKGNGNVKYVTDRKYWLKEITPPPGYALDKTIYEFKKTSNTSDGNVVYSVSCSDTPQMALDLTKISANEELTEGNSCYSLKGAVYQVFTDSNGEKALTVSGSTVTITTDEDGYGTYNNLALITAQTLYAKEIKAPPGYELDETVYQFYNSGKTVTKTVNGLDVEYPIYSLGTSKNSLSVADNAGNDPITVLLQKYDVTTGKGTNTEKLANAEYTINFYAGMYNSVDEIGDTAATRSWVFKTDSDGFLYFGNSYKVSGDEMYYMNDGITPCLPYGTITVQESKAPEGYQLNPEIYIANITESGDKISWRTTNENVDESVLQFPEQQDNGGLSIKKNATDGVIADVWFAVYRVDDSSEEFVGNFKTDVNGLISNSTLSELAVGEYRVSELGFSKDNGKTFYYPKRYGNKPADQTITVESGSTVTVTFENKALTGELIINKTADDNQTSGIYFNVIGSNGTSNRVVTQSNGQAKLSNLQIYDDDDNLIDYTIEELGVSDKTSDTGFSIPEYYISPTSQTVNLVDGAVNVSGGKRQTVNVYNEFKTLNISILKKSEDYAEDYSEIFYQITSDNGYNNIVKVSLSEDVAGTLDSNSSGYVQLTNLPALNSKGKYITYTVTELGYSDGDGGYYIPDYFMDVFLTKTITADPNAEVLNADLSYYGDVIIATPARNGKRFTAQASFINRHITASLSLYKDSYDNAISDIYFELVADNGYSSIEKTDSNGIITWQHLDLYNYSTGERLNYTVRELGKLQSDGTYAIPENYIAQDTITVKFDDDRTESIDFENETNWYKYVAHMEGNDYDTVFGSVDFYNDVVKGDLNIVKKSSDGDVNDYWFSVTDSEGNYLGDYSTGDSNTVHLDDLPVYNQSGDKIKYTATELGKCINESDVENGTEPIYEIPYRYNKPSSKTVTLSPNTTTNALTIITITNTLKTGSVTLYKQDENGNSLSGSGWQLFTSSGTPVQVNQTSYNKYTFNGYGKEQTIYANGGLLNISGLSQGDYYFIEVVAPKGRLPYAEKVPFTVSGDSSNTLNVELKVKDYNSVLFNTGSYGVIIFFIVAIVFFVAAIVTITIYFKKRNKFKNEREKKQ
jgi:hypothetical protein